MITVIQRMHLRLLLFIATGLVLAAPVFGGVSRVAAQSAQSTQSMEAMDTMDTMDTPISILDCAAYCNSTAGAHLYTGTGVLEQVQKRTPEPDPIAEPAYNLQFQYRISSRIIRPDKSYSTSVIRPPDIVTFLSTFRI